MPELLQYGQQLLVSTGAQLSGIGRIGNTWQHYTNALAFSFTLIPTVKPSMTPIVIGLQLIEFFQTFYQLPLKVKWPNDLLTLDFKKAVGVLCHQSKGVFLVGVGINWGKAGDILNDPSFKFPAGVLFPQQTLTEKDKEQMPRQICNYIYQNPMTPQAARNSWQKHCAHHLCPVEIITPQETIKGNFIGIGEEGDALLNQEGVVRKVNTGMLLFNP